MIQNPATIVYDGRGKEVFPAASRDAFGRFRVSNPANVFDSKQLFDSQPLFFAESTASGGSTTHSSNRASTLLETDGTSGSQAIRQTRRYFNYQPGKSLRIFATFVGGANDANTRKRVGYFDANNGIFFQNNGGTLAMVRRSFVTGAAVDEVVTSGSWNVDSFDGTGPSGITLDATKAQIFVVDLEWLGVGVVRTGFVIDGYLYYAHEFKHSNIIDSVYMSSPNLPVRWEIESLSATVASSLEAVCCSVESEGGADPVAAVRSVNRGTNDEEIGTTIEPLLSIRLKAAYNRAAVQVDRISVMSTGGANARWELAYLPAGGTGAISGGGGPSWVGVDNSAVEYDLTANSISGDYYVLRSGYFANNQDSIYAEINSAVTLAADIAGTTRDIICLLASVVSGGGEDFLGAIDYKELL